MSSIILITLVNIFFFMVGVFFFCALLFWLWWLVPNIIKFILWLLVIAVFVAPFLGAWHLGLGLYNLIFFFTGLFIFSPIRLLIYFVLSSLFYGVYLLRLAVTKLYRYTSRYFIFSSSINIMFDDLDFYWIEILRDWLYPNDDRYRLIYRRWVFWVNNDKYQERYDFYVTFLWGYLARNFTMALYLGWFYILRSFHKLLMKYLGTSLGCALVFFSLCLILVFIKILPSKIAEFLWLTYRFVYRQIYYLTGGFVVFETLRTLNWNWMDWDVSSNVDEFDEADFSLAREPGTLTVRFFHIINNKWMQLTRHGLTKLPIYTKQFSPLRKLLLQPILWVTLLLCNLMILGLVTLAQFLSGVFFLQFHIIRNFNWKLVKISTFKELFIATTRAIAIWFYSIIILFLAFLKPFFKQYIYTPLFFIPALLFYSLVKLWRVVFLIPLGLLFFIKFIGAVAFKLRALVLLVFLFLVFSKEYLSFFYFFSLGWFADIVLSTLDSVRLIPHEFHLLPFPSRYRLFRGYRPTNRQVYVVFWTRQFLDTLYTYQYYLLKNLQTLLRLRNFWKQVTGWKPWIFFIRFMPFFGQTTLIKKIWFERMYLWLHTPAILWWCYCGYDRFFCISWFISIVAHILIFLPASVFYRWFYYVYWLMPSVYNAGGYFYGTLGEGFINFWHFGGSIVIFIKELALTLFKLFIGALGWFVRQLFINMWILIKALCAMLFGFSWVYLLYIYLCCYEITSYLSYCLKCYWWLWGIMFGDWKHWISLMGAGALFSRWMKFYFMYGFFFNYLNYNWNSFYDWWITSALKRIYGYLPSVYYLVSLTDFVALNSNPIIFHVAFFLNIQKLLDTFCVNVQLPRDVQRNAYVFIRRRVLNVKFLRWLLPLRRTPMYSLDRWLMPVFSYFQVLGSLQLSGKITFNFLGPLDNHLLRTHFPAVYYGFIWNSPGVYFFSLLIILVLSREFTNLLFNPFSNKIDENREYAWKRFRSEHPRNLRWMFFDFNTAANIQDRVKSYNDLSTKFYYYEQLLKNATTGSHLYNFKKAMFKFYNASLWIPKSSLLYSEEDIFISPLFFDFYLKPRYVNFRTSIHKGDDLFIYFSAFAFSLNPWIHVAWDSADQEDYQVVGEEVTFHAPSRRQFISFHENVRALQYNLDQLVFSGQLSAWTLLKEPLNMSIIRTSFADDIGLGPSLSRTQYSHTPAIYEFEDDEDIMYVSWPVLAWCFAIPFMLFYKSFFFLGGFGWHYNRHSPNIIQSYMLYFNSVIGHFQLITYMRKLMGDNYYLHKREGSSRGFVHTHHYRSYIRNVIRKCFYSYKLPYRGTNSWMSLEKVWDFKTISFRFQYLTSSILEEIRFVNITLLFIFIFTSVLVWNDETRQKRNLPDPSYPINWLSLSNYNFVKSALKHVYLWFWR